MVETILFHTISESEIGRRTLCKHLRFRNVLNLMTVIKIDCKGLIYINGYK